MGDLVVARTSGVVMWGGRRRTLRRDVTVAHRDHPIVLQHPQLWRDLVVHYNVTVEQATAAPGERRHLPPPTPAREAEPAVQRPPTSGPGSGVDAWRRYAAAVTGTPLEQWADKSRDDIRRELGEDG